MVTFDYCTPDTNGAAERAVQSVDGMARTLRLDLLSRTNIVDGETRDMVVGSFPNWISRWKDGVCTTVRRTPRITCATFR